MSDWKQEVLKGAMKAMSNPTVQKIVSNEKTQKAFASAFKASYQFKTQIDETKANVAKRMNFATGDDLRGRDVGAARFDRHVEVLFLVKALFERHVIARELRLRHPFELKRDLVLSHCGPRRQGQRGGGEFH